ncbi:hypothetical protein EYV94_01260 [Puteibacter caeruleilacunae]|nr:hypothetical protein EYV94_01260 [Puteibacter caeruleilacunae]
MKKLLVVFLSLLVFAACSDSDHGNWIERSDFNGPPRTDAVCFQIDDKVYVGTGYDSSQDKDLEYFTDFWVFEGPTKPWKKVAPFPGTGRSGAVGFALNGRGYVGTGYGYKQADDTYTDELEDFYEFNPNGTTTIGEVTYSGSWTKVADFPGGRRRGALAFVLNGKAYVGTGYGPGVEDEEGVEIVSNDMYTFDGSNWVEVGSTIGKRQDASVFMIDGKAYIVGGRNKDGSNNEDFYSFDGTDWIELTDLDHTDFGWTGVMRSNAVSFSLDEIGYVALGTSKEVWKYDPTLDNKALGKAALPHKHTWYEKTEFEGTARTGAISFVWQGRIFLGLGGPAGSPYDDIWEFKPYDNYDDRD